MRHFFKNNGLPPCCDAYDDGMDSVAGTSGNGGESVGSPSGVDSSTSGYGGGGAGGGGYFNDLEIWGHNTN